MSSDEIQITINGEAQEVAAATKLVDVLRGRGLDPEAARGIAVAVNDEVVRRESWQDVAVAPGDRIEIVTAQAGG